MITVGLVKELLFIYKALKNPVESSLYVAGVMKRPMKVLVNNNTLFLFYCDFNIWSESLEEGISMFGVESCDNVAKIVTILDSGDYASWREFAYYEEKA